MKDRFFLLLTATIAVGVFLAIFNPTPVLDTTEPTTTKVDVVGSTTAPDIALSHKG